MSDFETTSVVLLVIFLVIFLSHSPTSSVVSNPDQPPGHVPARQERYNIRKRRWDRNKFKDNRQTIIHKLISDEVQYHKDLDVIEAVRFPTLRLAVGILPLTVLPRK